ncbi:ATPase [Neiella marina]|uniref:ATPase n=1 Tax=Neiella marina TaxID=508461 RepID=A0A8J2XNB8_9GAMM|nr:AAA family ATPase [Neiella marina]GGA67204.1 ATPase [Neiella marina]
MFISRKYHQLITQYLINALTSSDYDADSLESVNCKDFLRMTGHHVRLSHDELFDKDKLLETLSSFRFKTHDTDVLSSNCELLGRHMKLSAASIELLKLLVVMSCNFEFGDTLARASLSDDATQLIADTVSLSCEALVAATRELKQCPLFNKERFAPNSAFDNLYPVNAALVAQLSTKRFESYDELVQQILLVSPKAELQLSNFEHVDTDIMASLLEVAKVEPIQGLNILLYGPAGTGKTQLVRAMAEVLSYPLYEVHPIGGDSNAIKQEYDELTPSPCLRLQHLQLIQSLCSSQTQGMLIVDECEDIFSEYRFGSKLSKLTTNSLLEDNALPTIWITNDVDVFEPSHLRRFTYVMAVDKPPRDAIAKLIQSTAKGLRLSKPFVNELAKSPSATPATVTNACQVSRFVGSKGKAAEGIVSQVLDNLDMASGIPPTSRYKNAMAFDERYVNLTTAPNQLKQIKRGVAQLMDIRVLLTGPPGCGKTGYIHYLADALNQELITAKCSDILGKYVGESEQNVAKLFKRATNNQAILFLDEVDSLLMARDSMQRSHEIQLVNEFLQQIEQFEYPLFAATNFAKNLDHAVARRFDFKLAFEYLKPEQSAHLFKQVLKSKSTTAIERQLKQLKHLTPGDFAILTRRSRYATKPFTAQEALTLLEQENNRKQQPQSIGFIN